MKYLPSIFLFKPNVMSKALWLLLASVMFCLSTAEAQLDLHGQGSVAYVKSENGYSQYVYNNGNPTFAWRWDLFADMRINENITLLSNVRMLQDQVVHIDYFALRINEIGSPSVNAQLGLVDLPFGNLGERRFPKQNPFFNLPLMNEHITSLCESDYRLWVLDPGFAIAGDGVRILDQGLYDLGMKVYGTIGILDYAVALTNGMISETGTYSPNGLNPNGGFGKMLRLALTPFSGLTIGGSYAAGPYMSDQSTDVNSSMYGEDPRDYPQQIIMGDVDVSFGYFTFYGQAAYNIWRFKGAKEGESWEDSHERVTEDLKAFAYSFEGRYALTPRLSVAARIGGIVFGSITDSVYSPSGPVLYSGTSDHNVVRLESAVGYRITRELLVKCVYQWNRTYGVAEDPRDNLFAVQTVVTF